MSTWITNTTSTSSSTSTIYNVTPFISSGTTSITNMIIPDRYTHSHARTRADYLQEAMEGMQYEISRLHGIIQELRRRSAGHNPYVHASDVLEEFMRWASTEAKLTKHEFGELPIKLLFQYLIVRAAENDNEPAVEERRVLARLTSAHSRCGHCGRFTVRGMPYCDNAHAGAAKGKGARLALPGR